MKIALLPTGIQHARVFSNRNRVADMSRRSLPLEYENAAALSQYFTPELNMNASTQVLARIVRQRPQASMLKAWRTTARYGEGL